jgi:hypothetical protein
MDAFESLAADIFWSEGYWVRTGVKVELTREEKIRIARPSSPRWEIDLVAYSPTSNEILALECKSYLDSGGVHAAHFGEGSRYATRYKLFHDATLRETVLERLRLQMIEGGLCTSDARVHLGLVHAHATSQNAALLAEIFAANDWLLFGPEWICERLRRMSRGSYENSTAVVVAKLLQRGRGSPSPLAG